MGVPPFGYLVYGGLAYHPALRPPPNVEAVGQATVDCIVGRGLADHAVEYSYSYQAYFKDPCFIIVV